MLEGRSHGADVPRLIAHTTRFDGTLPPLHWAGPKDPLVFQQSGVGAVGLGRAVTAHFFGPQRFSKASSWWRAVVNNATLTGEESFRDAGLIAFGAFAFSDLSEQKSVLRIPELVIRITDKESWATTIHVEGQAPTITGPAHWEAPPVSPSPDWVEGAMGSEEFLKTVSTIKTRINNGDLGKVVIARDMTATVSSDFSPLGALRFLATHYPETHIFAIDGLFGASPETLCSIDGRNLSTTVLAGTIGQNQPPSTEESIAQSLLESAKDQAEHRFAVESVLTALSTQGITASAETTPHVVQLKNLMHLATNIHAELPANLNSVDIVAVIHPTGAVAGTPTAKALAIIRELEAFDRGWYAGPVGWMDSAGNGEWAIALRCAQYDQASSTLTAYAGAGVVADSIPEKELAETTLKFQPILDALSAP